VSNSDPTAARDGAAGADPPQPVTNRIMAADAKRQARFMGFFSRSVMVCLFKVNGVVSRRHALDRIR
jgi:hypothetical protein